LPGIDPKLQHALRDHYLLERELGRGGMAMVYLARDVKHDRLVALKVLHPELATSLGPERFLREIKLAARLQHPHILSVHDSGEAAGQLWFTMPYVEGESLRDRLRREGQLRVDDAVQIAREAAQALDYAHQHGVIHRDIKPENILLTRDGNVLVADFGIARALAGGGADGPGTRGAGGGSGEEERLTETGISLGTPAYMSPEQAAGERTVDARTDVYSLACVLYEMLAGEPPFTGPTAQAIIAKRFSTTATPIRVLRSDVSEHIDQAITTALARTPAGRFSSTGEFARALTTPPRSKSDTRRIARFAAVAIGLLLLAAAAWTLLDRRRDSRLATRDPAAPTPLAVLPFENQGSPEDEYFADGVTDAVRGKLAGLPQLRVIARSSSNLYKKTGKPPDQIGRELGVQYLLTGTVRWDKSARGQSRVQVNPELIQATTSSTQWQQPFDATLSDVFQVQTDIASRVARALDLALGEPQRRAIAAPATENLAAYDAFLRGEELSSAVSIYEPVKIREAVSHYQAGVRLDSTFALAWSQLSRALSLLYYNAGPDQREGAAARSAAERALALAPDRPEGRFAMGDYYINVPRNADSALAQYQMGRRLSPDNAELLTAAARAQQSLGRWQEALASITRAQIIDPRSSSTVWRKAQVLTYLRRYPEALAAVDQALGLFPASLTLLQQKAMIYLAQGDLSGARGVLRAAPNEIAPETMVAFMGEYWDLFWVLDEAQQRLLLHLTASAFDNNRGAWALVLAQTYALRGDPRSRAYADSARQDLERQLREAPDDAQLHTVLGLALAYSGRVQDGVREGERGTALASLAKDGYNGPYLQHQLARIYLLAGDRDKAFDRLEPLLKVPYYLSPRWLMIDPTFASLRSDPRFQQLVSDTTRR
jgi:serine/threonine protein kinase/tetratricopeptide (TPR) repeat protein